MIRGSSFPYLKCARNRILYLFKITKSKLPHQHHFNIACLRGYRALLVARDDGKSTTWQHLDQQILFIQPPCKPVYLPFGYAQFNSQAAPGADSLSYLTDYLFRRFAG